MIEAIILAVLIVAAAVAFWLPVKKRIDLITSGKSTLAFDDFGRRLGRWFAEVVFQSTVISQRRVPGFMHALVFWGFIFYIPATLHHFAEGFGFSLLGHGVVFRIVSQVVSLWSVLVLMGILYLAFRRFVMRPEALGKHLSATSGIVAVFITILMLTYLFGIHLFPPDSPAYKINWWVHTMTILAFAALIPHSKHLHLVFSPLTTFTKSFRLADVRPLDFEAEEFGAVALKDLSTHTALGAFTCVECGRCQDNCPAYQTGKVLNPKQLMLDLRQGYLTKPADAGVLTDEILPVEAIWQCTTCGACTYQCPVGIDQVVPILELRRGLGAEGEFPEPMTALMKNLERNGNPWGYTQNQAEEFLDTHEYPSYDGQEVLYWMGCLARYDVQYRQVSLAFTKILSAAGVGWGVLREEKCTGDAARRAGNEYQFQELALENIEALNAANPTTIVTTCPHCLRTLTEYTQLGLNANIRVVHHALFIEELLASGKLQLTGGNGTCAVYHDPCYLSRYEGKAGCDAPRSVLRSAGVNILEPRRTRETSFCCGAGGAQLFNEENQGERVPHKRTEELLATGAKEIAAGCPFCPIMLRDALAVKDVEDVQVKDIAQYVAERLG
jgi:Fe-S oxidoreductase